MGDQGSIRVGIAGWNFADWRGEFYPKGLPQKQELRYASRALGAIEINSTFYGHQKPESFASWAAETPAGFRFSVKGHQGITHIKRLKEVGPQLAFFFGSGVLALGDRLGPFVWQLPPNLKFDADRIERFLVQLPRTPTDLAAVAKTAVSEKRHAVHRHRRHRNVCGTPWRSGTTASPSRPSSTCCAATMWPW